MTARATALNPLAHQPSSQLRTLRLCSLAALGALALISVLHVAAWMFDIDPIKHPWPNQRPMLSACALNFLLASAAGLLILQAPGASYLRWLAKALAILAAIAGGLNLIEHWFNLDLGLAYPFWKPVSGAAPLSYPGPMTPDVAMAFLAAGAGLALYDLRNRKLLLSAQAALLLIAVNSLTIMACYAFGHDDLCAFFGCIKFSAITSMAFALLSVGVLLSRADRGLTAVLASESTGGGIVRRILACLIILPPVLAVLHAGQTAGLYDESIAAGLSIAIIVSFLAACVLWEARKIDTVVAEKRQVESILQETLSSQSKASRKVRLLCPSCGKESTDGGTHCQFDGSPLEVVPAQLVPGNVFADRYQILERLGSGGMSAVFKARHLHLDQTVAIKVLHPHFHPSHKDLKRFQQEARTTSELNHANIIKVHDFAVSPEGDVYLVMELLEGASLSAVLDREGFLPPARAVPIFLQICAGLQHAHDRAVMHRDLKPSNVMILPAQGRSEQVKLVDFGLAKMLAFDRQSDLTLTGEILGTVDYMSPEQCCGRQLDHRSDIYSLGCLMYECLSGLPPHTAETAVATFTKHVSDPAQPFMKDLLVPPALEEVVLKALRKRPDNRQQSCDELASELRAALAGRAGGDQNVRT